jgi:hypothetical protein
MNQPVRMGWRALRAVMVVGVLSGESLALAQSPDIVAFTGSGELTWTNGLTNLYYDVQWASAITGTGSWRSSYGSLENIQSCSNTVTVSVPMFYRVTGSSYPTHFAAPVPKTGQTFSYQAGDDGWVEAGIPLPAPRFAILADTNVVLDNLTGLMWVRNANMMGSLTNWSTAVSYCHTLAYGGLTGWRLPNRAELMSLVDQGQTNSSFSPGHPFNGVVTNFYWTSTTYAGDPFYAWVVWFGSDVAGTITRSSKSSVLPLWPVCGGQQ